LGKAVVVALTASIIYACAGPWLARRLPPAIATRILVAASVAVAATAGFVLAESAFTLIAQQPEIAEAGQWSVQTLRASDPIPRILAAASGLLLGAALSWTALVGIRRARAMLSVHLTCRQLGAPGSLVVLQNDHPDAFTTPGLTGRIVVTTGMLRGLDAQEQRALLAHERSHLTHRHAWWTLAADLAAAANPLLRPTARAISHAVERWADEDAAETLADRRLVARAVARAALLRSQCRPQPASAATLAATAGDVPDRVRALLSPRPRHRARHLAVIGVLLVTSASAAIVVEHGVDKLLDHASTEPVRHGDH
jgi:Zn-dependent protease with chaperone function